LIEATFYQQRQLFNISFADGERNEWSIKWSTTGEMADKMVDKPNFWSITGKMVDKMADKHHQRIAV
jgi:hypothetical protein